ncbi:AAA family ATPase [Yoonia sp. F2084L]|uniref:AAA family ATPase n=1 Tax=Yoonia sp. F2084L TaxID=2926419 RepID=UPI001FF61EAC|nr:AAA family ATPase [Yoonia sp. F2084L]MCK0095014.1 AAA family ATPase [Yoonia sp. F2084L]
MLVLLNGAPGVGKLTVGRELSSLLEARLLDVHTVYNLSFALTEFKSEAFFKTIRSIWALADELISELPVDETIVFTETLAAGSPWAEETWARYERLAKERGPLCSIHLSCSLDENSRRISSIGRSDKRKPQDPEYARSWHERDRPLMGYDTERLLTLETTNLSARQAAQSIRKWIYSEILS